jgi:hypothetical protein
MMQPFLLIFLPCGLQRLLAAGEATFEEEGVYSKPVLYSVTLEYGAVFPLPPKSVFSAQ